jgi:hypothetical protein
MHFYFLSKFDIFIMTHDVVYQLFTHLLVEQKKFKPKLMPKKSNNKKWLWVDVIVNEAEEATKILEKLEKKPGDITLLKEKNLLFEKLLKKLEVSPQKFSSLTKELKNNKEFILKCPKRSLRGELQNLGNNLKDDDEIVLECLKNENNFIHASDRLRNDKKFIKRMIQIPKANLAQQFQFISKELQNDKNFIIEMIKMSHEIYEHVPKKYFDDKEIVISAIHNRRHVKINSEKLLNDRDFAKEAFKHNSDSFTIKQFPKSFREDRELCIICVSNNGYSLSEYPKFQNDKEVVLKAISGKGYFEHGFISDELMNDEDVILELLKRDYSIFRQTPYEKMKKFFDNEEIMMEVIKRQHAYFLPHRQILKNLNIARFSCLKNPRNYEIIPLEFKDDIELALGVVKNDGSYLQKMNNFRNNKLIAKAAIENKIYSFRFVSYSLKMNRDFIMDVCRIKDFMKVMRCFPFDDNRKYHPLAFDREIEWKSKKYFKLIKEVVSNVNFYFE